MSALNCPGNAPEHGAGMAEYAGVSGSVHE